MPLSDGPTTDPSVDPRVANPAPEKPKALCPMGTPELVDTVLRFIVILSGIDLYNYQQVFCRRIIESILVNDGDEITALWARQCGKTEAIADLGFGLAVILPCLAGVFPDDPRLSSYIRGFKIGIYAPIDRQAKISFSRMRTLSTNPKVLEIMEDPEISVRVTTSRGDALAFSNGSFIQASSASPDSKIEGDTWHLVMLEESQDLTQTKVEKEISPMLTSTNGTMVKIGTAGYSRGGFHKSIQDNIALWKKSGKRNHFEFPYNLVVAEKEEMYRKTGNVFHLKYRKYVEKQIKRLGGTHTTEFRMNYMCIWNESRILAVNPDTLKSVGLDTMEAVVHKNGFQVGGLDIGKVTDSTVLTVMEVDYNNPVINPIKVQGQDEDRQQYYRKGILDWFVSEGAFEGHSGQYESLVGYIIETGIRVLCMDTTGVGDAFYERLDAMLGDSVIIIPFNFALPNKAKLYKYYLQEFHAGRIYYPAGPLTRESLSYQRFVQEHTDLDRIQHGLYTTFQHPDIEGAHDDFPDSAALACWAEKMAPTVEMGDMKVDILARDGSLVSSMSNSNHTPSQGGSRAGRYVNRRSR